MEMIKKAAPRKQQADKRRGRITVKPAGHVSRPARTPGGTKREVEREQVSPLVENDEIVSGRHPVIEALRAGRPINKIVIAEGTEGGSLTEIIGKAKAARIVIQTAPRAHLNKVAGDAHQGVMAFMAPHAYAELEEIVGRKTGMAPLVLLLDEVADPHNLGAIVRSAEATGAQGVVIPKRRAVPLTGVVAKAAAGALEYVPVARVTNLVQAMERLKEMGYWIIGTSLKADKSYTEVDYTGKVAVVIGAEGKGLSRLVEERCDFLVQIPMRGKVQSLNASVAAGVLLYEVIRQRS
jgi:23S rRNA (guanosine2251-2'-O)-methyltransferase